MSLSTQTEEAAHSPNHLPRRDEKEAQAHGAKSLWFAFPWYFHYHLSVDVTGHICTDMLFAKFKRDILSPLLFAKDLQEIMSKVSENPPLHTNSRLGFASELVWLEYNSGYKVTW